MRGRMKAQQTNKQVKQVNMAAAVSFAKVFFQQAVTFTLNNVCRDTAAEQTHTETDLL